MEAVINRYISGKKILELSLSKTNISVWIQYFYILEKKTSDKLTVILATTSRHGHEKFGNLEAT